MNDKIQKEIEARERGRLFECILNLNPIEVWPSENEKTNKR